MKQAGAPLRHVQELPGHNSIEATQICTQLTVADLKEAHRRFHPRGSSWSNDNWPIKINNIYGFLLDQRCGDYY